MFGAYCSHQGLLSGEVYEAESRRERVALTSRTSDISRAGWSNAANHTCDNTTAAQWSSPTGGEKTARARRHMETHHAGTVALPAFHRALSALRGRDCRSCSGKTGIVGPVSLAAASLLDGVVSRC